MGFVQDAPQLPHPLHADRLLQRLLQRALPAQRRNAIDADLRALAEYAQLTYARRQRSTRQKPLLTQFDAWGKRVDRIELTEAWREGPKLTTLHAILAAGHDDQSGAYGRLEEFIRVYLYHVPSEFYSCPLAMTDGAVTAIKASANQALIDRALPHFLSRDAEHFWLSGQWMTETSGGSDIGGTETVARQGDDGQWRLYGRKWFTSAVVGEAALALARPEGKGEGAAALALFYVETKDADGAWRELRIDRLKDKLGTQELPTAELHLDGLPATPVGELAHGVRQVAPMLNVTRTWNAVGAVASMARCIALARDYATRRQAFGQPLIEQPLHARTLAGMQAEFEAAFGLAFEVAALLGRVEHEQAAEHEPALLRVLTPLAKLWTGKLAVRIASETLECFGGAGYIENTGVPQLLRDAQVYSIWEGTTNVLSLDTLRALAGSGLGPLRTACLGWLDAGDSTTCRQQVTTALDEVNARLELAESEPAQLQSGARDLALTLARCAAAALLSREAARSMREDNDSRPRDALNVFLLRGLDPLPMPALDALQRLASEALD